MHMCTFNQPKNRTLDFYDLQKAPGDMANKQYWAIFRLYMHYTIFKQYLTKTYLCLRCSPAENPFFSQK